MKSLLAVAAVVVAAVVLVAQTPPTRHRFAYGDRNRPTAFVNDYDVDFTDSTYGNVSATAHGFVPKIPNTTTTFFRGDGTYTSVTEAGLTLAANTTDNVTTTRHGFAPVLPNDATKYLDGTGAYSVPAGAAAPAVRNLFGSWMSNAWSDVGTTSSTLSGSRADQFDAGGAFSRWTSSGTTNAQAGVRLTGNGTWLDYNPDINVRLRTPSDITNIVIWAGCFNSGFPTSSDAPAGRSVGVRYSTRAGDTSWVGFYTDSTPATHLTSAIGTIAASTIYDIRINVTGAGTSAAYTINGTTATQSMTSATGVSCAFAVYVVETTTSARSIDWTRLVVQTN